MDQATCSSFSSLELPGTHIDQMSYPADKCTSEQSLPEFRQRNFNFHFGAQAGTEVFGHNSFEGQLFQGTKNEDFHFTPQTDLESNDNLEFELDNKGDKSAPGQPLGNVMVFIQEDSSPMCAQTTGERTFGQQTFCSDSNVVDLVDHLSAVKSGGVIDSSKAGASAKPIATEKGAGSADAKRSNSAVDTENFFKKFTSIKRYDSVVGYLKGIHTPDFVGDLVTQPKLNDTLRERLQRDTKSRQEKQLTSAALTLTFDERVSKYQAELNQLLKPVFKMLELTTEKSIDANRMREALGSMITLIAALNGTCSSDRRQSVMNHYGILGETTNNVGKEKELFTDEFLTVHGFALKKDGQKRLAAMKNLKPTKRKRKGKQQTPPVVPVSEPDSGESRPWK